MPAEKGERVKSVRLFYLRPRVRRRNAAENKAWWHYSHLLFFPLLYLFVLIIFLLFWFYSWLAFYSNLKARLFHFALSCLEFFLCSKCPLLSSYLLIDKLHCSRVLPSFRTLFIFFLPTYLVSSLKNVLKSYYKNHQSSLPSCVYYNLGIVWPKTADKGSFRFSAWLVLAWISPLCAKTSLAFIYLHQPRALFGDFICGCFFRLANTVFGASLL